MAEVPVTLNGVLYDLYGRTTERVVFIGQGSLTGLGVGGGPVYPSRPPGQPGWGPEPPPHPEHPIVMPPPGGGGGGGQPGAPTFPIWGPPGSNFPDKPGYPPVAGHPLPEPPVPELPPDLPTPVPPSTIIKHPPEGGGWGLYTGPNSEIYWGYTPAGGGPK